MRRGYAFDDQASGVIASALGVSLNSAGSDTQVAVRHAKYIPRRIVVTNPSTGLGASLATLGVFTAAGGGGTTVAAAATMTGLTGASKFVDLTLSLTADVLTAATLYIRNVVAHGGAATVDVYLIGDVLA